MRKPEDKHQCPLFDREIYWGGAGGCYEVQEVRENNMDLELFPGIIDVKKANEVCEKRHWCYVNEQPPAHKVP